MYGYAFKGSIRLTCHTIISKLNYLLQGDQTPLKVLSGLESKQILLGQKKKENEGEKPGSLPLTLIKPSRVAYVKRADQDHAAQDVLPDLRSIIHYLVTF